MASFPQRVAVFLTLLSVMVACSASPLLAPRDLSKQSAPANVRLIAIAGDSNSGPLSDVEIISISGNSHAVGASLPTSLFQFSSVISNNTIYVLGGDDPDGFTSRFLAYDVAANKWTTMPEFPYGVIGNALAAVDGSIYSFGGTFSGGWPVTPGEDRVFKYDAGSKKWRQLPTRLPVESPNICVVVDQSNVYFLDTGYGGVYRSTDSAKTWTKLNSTFPKTTGSSCVFQPSSRAIIVAGGMDFDHFQYLTAVNAYYVDTNTWEAVAPMLKPRENAQAVVIPDDDVVVCGGYDGANRTVVALTECERYNWKENKWTTAEFSLKTGRGQYGLFVSSQGI